MGSPPNGNPSPPPPLNTAKPLPQRTFHRIFGVIYSLAILALLFRHVTTLLLLRPKTLPSFLVTLSLLVADLVLAFMWATTQALRAHLTRREEHPEAFVVGGSPGMDVFICTADPYKEPPSGVVNTALSVMAYDYPKERLSVYVSDDGGSALTLFAFMEGAKFARRWLPFCQRYGVVERSPEVYFRSGGCCPFPPDAEEIQESIYVFGKFMLHVIAAVLDFNQMMYENMKAKVEHVLDKGRVMDEYINGEKERAAFRRWEKKGFTKQDHPAVVELLLDSSNDRDVEGQVMPNLIYLSREKSSTSPHHFKAGSLNSLLRVSAAMTNAPIILTLDCDMYSNDPQTPARALCYFCGPASDPNLAYLQFPQRFQGVNDTDIYAGEYQRLYQIQPMGFDGLMGPNYLGSGCFFRRRAFFGGPDAMVMPEDPALGPNDLKDRSVGSREVLELAHEVAGCKYEDQTNWGSKIGFRYGSLSEDYFTGYLMKCEGWRSGFTYPERAAFLGDAPTTFLDMLNQQKRWSMGLLQVGFSKYSPLTYGVKHIGPLMALSYAQYSYWPIWSVPTIIYALLPQLALLHRVPIFPEVWDPWFWLYGFLFLGSYLQDYIDFAVAGGTFRKWWNDQRIWLVRGTSCCFFGALEYFLKWLGVSSSFNFNVTSKVQDDDQTKRYKQGLFEFGVHSPMFVSLAVVGIVNLASLLHGLVAAIDVLGDGGGGIRGLMIGEVALAGFGVANCWPVYEAMVLRSDKGKLPVRTSLVSASVASAFYLAAALLLK